MQQESSETTGALEAVMQRALAGLEHGKTGSSKSVSVSDETVRGWLLAQPSTAMADRALLTSLQSSLNVEVSLRSRSMFRKDGSFYLVPEKPEVRFMDDGDRSAALARMRNALAGPTKEQVEDWLVMLQAACAGGRKSEVSQAVALEVYSGALMRYPADVAREACMTLAARPRDSANWFPTLSELVSEADRIAAPRRAIVDALMSSA